MKPGPTVLTTLWACTVLDKRTLRFVSVSPRDARPRCTTTSSYNSFVHEQIGTVALSPRYTQPHYTTAAYTSSTPPLVCERLQNLQLLCWYVGVWQPVRRLYPPAVPPTSRHPLLCPRRRPLMFQPLIKHAGCTGGKEEKGLAALCLNLRAELVEGCGAAAGGWDVVSVHQQRRQRLTAALRTLICRQQRRACMPLQVRRCRATVC
ncbi:hypothetical protein JKP88DRAFT_226720 [Tribonema minus]|uniref:Uncharacterized protein n=1 Tax=Tribonema minus TaxID=303371 RepID=A0A835YL37_9STRA|nr:hypothetical protein JKP88DRAFT_226720 [Tribonema minus]